MKAFESFIKSPSQLHVGMRQTDNTFFQLILQLLTITFDIFYY